MGTKQYEGRSVDRALLWSLAMARIASHEKELALDQALVGAAIELANSGLATGRIVEVFNGRRVQVDLTGACATVTTFSDDLEDG